MSGQPRAMSPGDAVTAMTDRLSAIDRAKEPVLWATTAYRLGMATAEQPAATPHENLRRALALYAQAAEILTASRAPVEHARILNAAGSCHRMLGDRDAAMRLFREAHELMTERAGAAEQASVLNNLGLVLSETGRLDDAVDAFRRSLDLVAGESDEERRTALATKHNLGQVHLARGGVAGCDDAIAVLQDASAQARTVDAAMHAAMIDHSLGIAWKARAALEVDTAAASLDEAVVCFERCLATFTTVGFPLQHAIAKHNLGHALAGYDDLSSLQRALVSYEDALNIFDPRIHEPQWREAFENAEAVEARLQVLVPGAGRADHTAALVGAMEEHERKLFLRQRLAQMERLPEQNRVERLTRFAYAVVTQPAESFVRTLRTTIAVLMELPEDLLESALRGQVSAHRMLDPRDQRAADFVLDEAIDATLFGPQRIRVRDMLAEIGWDRP